MITELIVSICSVMSQVFIMLDSAYVDSWSLLDIFLSIEFLSITVWFICEILTTEQKS